MKTLREALISASERMLKSRPGPREEFHHPKCPKWVTQGKRACRCGAAPTEAIFEDALNAMDEGSPAKGSKAK